MKDIRPVFINQQFRKLSQSFRCAFRGLGLCVRQERNFRIHICAACYVAAFALIARLPLAEDALLCLCFALMLCAELLNTAIERWCDMGRGGYSSHVRDAKDIAAAAVFICAAFCVVIGGILFLQPCRLCVVVQFFWKHLWALGVLLCSIPVSITFIFGLLRRK